MIREVIFWGDYFEDFYLEQESKVRKKIDYVLWLICTTERVPIKFLKHHRDTDGPYEVKISTTFKEIRILCFFDDSSLVVLINGFYKKSQKTPKREIILGKKLKEEYFDFKNKG